MSKHDPRLTLRQIVEYIEHAQELCRTRTPEDFDAEWESGFAFERVMEVLGEAVKRLPSDLCQKYPQVPWKLVAGMRDRISHGYDGIDYQTLVDAVQDDLPLLRATVEDMLRDLGTAPESGRPAE
jgi:uncharacterized protein with HEPN domain